MGRIEVEKIPYEDYSNRQLAAIPLGILALALLILLGSYLLFGSPVALGMDFTGGTEVRVDASGASQGDVEQAFSEVEPDSVRSVTGSEGTYIVTTQETDTDLLRSTAEDAGYEVQSINTRSASFGSDAQREALLAVLLAFIGMSILIAVIFRSFIPSLAVVASAFSDIIIPVALMRVFGIELSLGAVAALLMLIGYSVDSDILLNNHILRRHGDFYESTFRAMRTGVSMTLTSIAAMTAMFLTAFLLGIPLLDDVALILVFGLTADLMNTYLMNLSLLRWYKFEGVSR